MMMIPRKRNDFNLFEDIFDDPFFERRETKLMRTDIKEKDSNYVIEVDLPGYEKEDIEIELEKGYLKVTAKVNNTETNEGEKYIQKERFYGECSRSFYVGDNIKQEDIKAGFKNGILSLTVPKEQEKRVEEKKFIQID